MKRIQMNTWSIRKNFAEVYSEFFSRNDLVLSGCFSLPWGPGGYGHRSQFAFVTSKIPLKCYLGVKFRKDSLIVFKDVTSYNVSKNDFETYPFKEVNKEAGSLMEAIREFLDGKSCKKGIEFEILSETTRGHSFGFSGTALALISTATFMTSSALKSNLLSDYRTFVNSGEFKEIFEFGLSQELKARYSNSVGQTLISTLTNSKNPHYLISENTEENGIPVLKTDYIDLVGKYEDTLISDSIPLDYMMIFTGIPTDSQKVESYKKADENRLKELSGFIRDEVIPAGLENTYISKFAKKDSINSQFIDNISILSALTIQCFKNLFEKGMNQSTIEEFIDHINSYRFAVALIEKQSDFAEDFIHEFKKNAGNKDEKIGIVPIYTGKVGGGYLVVTKQGLSTNTISNSIDSLRNRYPDIAIEYSSNLDGECEDGIKIEQYISESIYSPYVQKDKVILKDSDGEVKTIQYKSIFENDIDGLLLDTITNKMFFNGKKLTSKEVHSQSVTVEVLNLLCENLGNEISNKILSSSSYSKSKNEMISKIIVPLIRFIKESTGEDLQLVCKGNMTDFFLRLNPSNVKISVIKKI